jgi:hypothetical protein
MSSIVTAIDIVEIYDKIKELKEIMQIKRGFKGSGKQLPQTLMYTYSQFSQFLFSSSLSVTILFSISSNILSLNNLLKNY